MPFDHASRVQEFLGFGELGDVNPSITDSSTFTFMDPQRMDAAFEHEIEGCFVYSRQFNLTHKHPVEAIVRMEDGESARVMASGLGTVSTTLMAPATA